MHRIEHLLRCHIGLDAAAIGASLIERAVRLRMKQHSLKNTDTYCGLLATSGHEMEQLIETVVVTETWFFRDREPFDAFARLARKRVRGGGAVGAKVERQSFGAGSSARDRGGPGTRPATLSSPPMRVLSLPCASGEEPYSLAMALLDAGVPASAFAIDAVDISANALARAARAVYGKNSFRGRELQFRDRHFQPTPEGYALSSSVRQCVRFEHGNAFDNDFLAGRPPYPFVFCRNLLIYFDRASQSRLLGKLRRLLDADGVLFVGPAELPLAVANGFVNAGLPMAFACHKAAGEASAEATPSGEQSVEGRTQESGSRPSTPKPGLYPPEERAELHVARQHAAAGRFAEAAALCHAHLTREGPSAQAFYLLGLVKDAGHDPEAITYYRKALYLAPKHYEALVQLARALEKAGDMGAARLTQRRAERAVAELGIQNKTQ